MEDLKRVVAFVVKRKGREIKEEDFVNTLSYDMKWVSPNSARALFKVAVDTHLIERKNEHYEPTFEMKGLILPLDFKVTEEDVAKYFTKPDIFTRIMDHLTFNLKRSRRDILMEINEIKNRMKYVSIEVAALIYCKENEMDCSEFYQEVEKRIMEL
ncbi:hypothetical protein AciM339_1048 [Aciduliprofundum sp. MAR08-339]|uniref:DUF2240 family protein n=1 Tax=Aciduliprofundum sp. (strain MAR08-339) TaxID=673860 RepID=UPI0002A487D6|nr:hypothetical protein AciM339_1048 [Aciduliprofundum sp. MAR08-339]